MKDFCKIFIVDGVQVLFRKGIFNGANEGNLVIFVNVFRANMLNNGISAYEIPIPCCCVDCQNKKFEMTDQTHADLIYREVILKQKDQSLIYQPHRKN